MHHLMSCEAEGPEYLGHLAVRQQSSVGSDTGGWGREALLTSLLPAAQLWLVPPVVQARARF